MQLSLYFDYLFILRKKIVIFLKVNSFSANMACDVVVRQIFMSEWPAMPNNNKKKKILFGTLFILKPLIWIFEPVQEIKIEVPLGGSFNVTF